MTLVVARTSGTDVCLVGDSQISFPVITSMRDHTSRLVSDPLAASLKVVALSPAVAIAYAGTIELAATAIVHLKQQPLLLEDHRSICEYLHQTHLALGGDVDFLICNAGEFLQLSQIKDGLCLDHLATAYIGSPLAFDEFQRAYATIEAVPSLSHFGEITFKCHEAMRAVIANQVCPGVSGFVVRLATCPEGGLKYLTSAAGQLRAVTTSAEPVTASLSTASEGAYSFSVLMPDPAAAAVFGVHFFEGKFGIVVEVGNVGLARIVRDVGVDEFIRHVFLTYGVILRGFDLVAPRKNQ